MQGESKWVCIFSKADSLGRQSFSARSLFSKIYRKIDEMWKAGYDLTALQYGVGKWIAVFSEDAGYDRQKLSYRESFEAFAKAFEQRRKEGYSLVNLTYGW
ncbi:hypothetical protein D1872_324110 [compost metagenome]